MVCAGRLRQVGSLSCWMGLLIFAVAGCSSVGGGGGAADPFADNDNSAAPDDQAGLVAREIEEADIVKYDRGYLYLANRWRGLRIIDVRTIERPELVGGYSVTGRAVELYVRDDHVFLVTSADHFYCAGEPVGFEDTAVANNLVQPDYTGSRFWVFDVSDPENPGLVRMFEMNGFVTATRRVGDVIYIAGNELEPLETPDDATTNGESDDGGTNGTESPGEEFGAAQAAARADSVFVKSINIADAANPQAMDFVRVSGEALELQASTRAVYVAGPDPAMFDTTRITYVDISDPVGDIEVRDQFRVPGLLRNRFFMDEYGDVLRVVTQEEVQVDPFRFREIVSLYSFDISDADRVDRLSRLRIETDEDVWAVRFDGPRGYVVTFRQIDPLFVLDLSDPENPEIAGELEVPGFSTHLVPLGERLVAIGFDDAVYFRPAVTLYDVSTPWAPQMVSRVVIGDLRLFGVTSEATFDEKALKVLEDEELILVPYSYLDEETLEWVDSLQMIDLLPDRLRERGKIDHRGLVRRADVLDERLWVLSDEAFGVFDIDDRDEPLGLARADIITEQELLDAGLSDCVDSARFRRNPTGIFLPGGLFGDLVITFPGLCGAVPLFTLGLLFAGLALLRVAARRI